MKEIKEYIILDIETAKLNKKKDYINEIVAIKYKDNKIIDKIHHRLGYKCPKSFYNIYKDFIGDYPLVVHNYSYINYYFPLEIKNYIIDTQKLSKVIYPNLKDYCIYSIAKYLGYEIEYERGLYYHALLIKEIYTSINKELLDNEIRKFILNNKDNVSIAVIQRKFIIGYYHAKKLLNETIK